MRARPALTSIALIMLAAYGMSMAAEMQKIKVGEITVSYSPGLETQARELAKAAGEVLPPCFARHRKLKTALSDSGKVVKRTTDILGCPEFADMLRQPFEELMRTGGDLAVNALSDIRVYRESELKASGGLREGAMILTYDAKTDEFTSTFDLHNTDDKQQGRVFWPMVVKDDGTFRTRKPLPEELVTVFNEWSFMPLVSIHEIAEGILASGLSFYHPFARWFNDGVANWTAIRVADGLGSEYGAELRTRLLPKKEHETLKSKVNLLSWPQNEYVKSDLTSEEQRLDATCYLYATEAVDRMMRGQPSDAMPKIIAKLKGTDRPDTSALCKAIKEVTGADASGILQEYMPEDVRKALKAGQAPNLWRSAQSAVKSRDKDYSQIYQMLSRSAEIDPNNADVQYNLAFVMRKLKMPNPESERHARIAAGLCTAEHMFTPLEPEDVESMYLMAGMNAYAGDEEMARQMFKAILDRYPDHADAKKALEEMEKRR